MTPSALKQKVQEDENKLPYHYVDVLSEESRLVWEIERRTLMEYLKKNLAPFRGQRILDAGCGDGRFCYELCGERVGVVGVDISEKAISFARVFNPGARFLVADLANLPVALGQFDQIVCQETLEHIPPEKVDAVLDNLARVLKPGGKIIFTVPAKKLRVSAKHFQHFDESSLREALEAHFIITRLVGHNVTSFNRAIFLASRYLVAVLFPFRSRYRQIDKLCATLRNFYEDNLVIGNPEDGLGLVAVGRKKR